METWEDKQARLAREKAKRKRQNEIDGALLMGYLAGNSGTAYEMYAVNEMVGDS